MPVEYDEVKGHLSKNMVGYKTNTGAIYLGKCHDSYIYTMPMDLLIDNRNELTIDEANSWLQQANSKEVLGYNDWDLPTGYTSTNELRLFSEAKENKNEIFKFDPTEFYGSKTQMNENRYYEIFIANGEVSSFNPSKYGAFFRAVRRSKKLII